jgi:hypothetical protein
MRRAHSRVSRKTSGQDEAHLVSCLILRDQPLEGSGWELELTCLHINVAPVRASPLCTSIRNLFCEVVVISGPLLVHPAVEEGEQIVDVRIVDTDRDVMDPRLDTALIPFRVDRALEGNLIRREVGAEPSRIAIGT